MKELSIDCWSEKTEKVSYVISLNHQLHHAVKDILSTIQLVVMHALSTEQAINNFLHICSSLCDSFLQATVALYYNNEKLKRLLAQRQS